jgi:hypothetical protein
MLAGLGWWKWPLLILVVMGLLAVASFVTTAVNWDGWFPRGQIRVYVVDESGAPLPGVSLRVTEPVSGRWTGVWPLEENTTDRDMVSDANGVITCHSDGLEFGGFYWDLFWVIPLGTRRGPEFNFEFAKDGFQSRILADGEFFRFDGQTYDSAPKVTTRSVYGAEENVPVWTQKVTLRRRK